MELLSSAEGFTELVVLVVLGARYNLASTLVVVQFSEYIVTLKIIIFIRGCI